MPENYTKVAIALHWIIGVAIIIMLVMGMVMEDVPDDYKFLAYQTHKSVGLTISLIELCALVLAFVASRAPSAGDDGRVGNYSVENHPCCVLRADDRIAFVGVGVGVGE